MLEHSLFNISTKSSGFTAIFGSNLDSIASSFQTQDVVQEAIKSSKTCPSRHSQPHITLITREDASLLKSKSIEPETLFPTPTLQDLHFIGLGSVSYSSSTTKRNLSFHVVVISPSINRIRLKNGLPMKDFHVTLTGDGSEQTGKPKSRGLDSLLEKLNLEPRSNNVEVLEALSKHHLLQGNLLLALETSVKLVTFLISRTLPSDRSSSTSEGESSRTDLIETLNQLPRALLLLGNMAFENSQFRLAMLSFSKSYSTSKKSHEPTTKIQTAAIRGILSCWKFTELGNCCLKEEWLNQLSTLPTSISKMIFQPWDPELKEEIRSRVETKSRDIGWSVDDRLVCERGKRLMVPIEEFELGLFDARPEDKVDFHEMQRFFSWVIPFRLCSSSTPREISDISALKTLGITHVLTLTAETPLPDSWFSALSIGYTFLPIEDGRCPSLASFRIFSSLAIEVMEKGGCLLVHCAGGKGRAGSILSAYISAFGFESPPLPLHSTSRWYGSNTADKIWTYPQLGASQAIEKIRTLRPGSIETQDQEAGIKKWVQEILQNGAFPKLVEEPEPTFPILTSTSGKTTLETVSCPRALDDIDLLILVGLPGSGKSFFRKLLCARDPSRWQGVNGDEDGGRKAVEAALSNFGKNSSSHSSFKGLIVDQCSVTASSRKVLLQLAHRSTKPVVVYFNYSEELCSFRASCRPSHPSIRPSSASNIVNSFSKNLEHPSIQEGFSSIVTVDSFSGSIHLALLLSPIGIFKFPRTAHLLNLGAATDDDIVGRATISLDQEVLRKDREPSSSQLETSFTKCLITEKIDGANVGISLSDCRSLQVQNRSHWISSDPQFKKVELWLDRHRVELHSLLDRDNEGFPARFILFGEWMSATHSIPYTHLASLFIAFDLYDRMNDIFLPRAQMMSLFQRFSPSISVVPLLHVLPSLPSDAELKAMVQSKSQYYDGRLEGVYIKLENQTKVLARGKCVRADFIAGNEHWSKGIRKWNGILEEN